MNTIARSIRALIADDEPLARDCVRVALEKEPDVEIVAQCGDGHEAVEAIRRLDPDLVFLDVQMPGLDGFAVVEEVGPDAMPDVIFVTAFDDHAVRAFEIHALDYVLKPFDDVRFHEAVEHARHRLRMRREGELSRRLSALLGDRARGATLPPTGWATRLVVRERDRIRFVRVAEIDWLEAYGNYIRIHAGARTHLIRGTLSGLLERLDPVEFARIHRSIAANLDRVTEVQPWSGGDLIAVLRDGRQLRVSRNFKESLIRFAV